MFVTFSCSLAYKAAIARPRIIHLDVLKPSATTTQYFAALFIPSCPLPILLRGTLLNDQQSQQRSRWFLF